MREACPRAGREPFPFIAPTQENRSFSPSISRLSGTVCAALRWTPDQFWDATPAELAAISAVFADNAPGHLGLAPLGTEQLEKLKETFPDG